MVGPKKQGEYIVVDDVPIFDESDEYPVEKLKKIIANCNARVADTSDAAPICIGHTRDDNAETDQPEIVGFATHFKLGLIGKIKPRNAILATFKFLKDKWKKAKQYPRRSVELHTKDLYIDPIALLSSSTPAKDLGLLFSKNKSDLHTYSMNPDDEEKSMDNLDDVVSKVLEALESSDVFAWCRSQMDKAPEQMEDDDSPDQMADEEDKDKVPEPEAFDEEEEEVKSAKLRAAKSEVEKYRRENEAMKASVDAINRKLRLADRERDLTLIGMEGVMFDVGEELEAVADLSPEKYKKHLDTMRKRYQRSPVGVHINPARIGDHGGEPDFDKAQMEKAIELVSNKRAANYREALQMVKSR